MFHDQHVSHKWHDFAIILMPWPEPPMGISSVGSFPVQSGGSYFILEPGMFYTHMSDTCPTCLYAPMFPYISLYAWGYLHVIWGNTPYVGVWGHQHICQAFAVCQYIRCSQSVGYFLLDWLLGCILCHLVPF